MPSSKIECLHCWDEVHVDKEDHIYNPRTGEYRHLRCYVNLIACEVGGAIRAVHSMEHHVSPKWGQKKR